MASRVAGLSRTRAQSLIKEGRVLVNGRPSRVDYRLRIGQRVDVVVPEAEPSGLEPEEVAFEVLYEDAHIVVIDKPPGVVVHPGAGHRHGTVVHGLLRRCKDLSGIGGVERPGIVHRLDKDTSGVLVIAKNDAAHLALSGQLKEGEVKKLYLALVHGILERESGMLDLSIGRNPRRRKEMTVVKEGGRKAVTHWRTLRTFGAGFSFLRVGIKTGRTHQIRVHMAHIGHPIVGDAVYGFSRMKEAAMEVWRCGGLPRAERQLLHASKIGIRHPATGDMMSFEAPLPRDMKLLLDALEKYDMREDNPRPAYS